MREAYIAWVGVWSGLLFGWSRLEDVVRRLAGEVRRHPGSLLPGFDDAGGVEIGGVYLLVKVDGFAASRALYPWCSYRDFGFRAVTGAVSDVFAKGCKPYVYAVSVGVTPERVEVVEEVVRGVEEAVEAYGGYVENLDTNVGNDVWVDVFVLAECPGKPVPRGARPGDAVLLTRRVGLSAVAYLEHSRGRVPVSGEVREFSCRPRAPPEVAEVVSEFSGCLSGSTDVSDTLFEALQQLAEAGGVGVSLDLDPRLALHPLAAEYARESGVPEHVLLLASSEEYVPVLACRSGCGELAEALRSRGLEAITLGSAVEGRGVRWRGSEVKGIAWDYATGRILLGP